MKKILIVEDDKHIQAGLVDNLQMEGYLTVTASDGLEAFDKYKENSPDLIVLDITLPKMNGFDVCRKIKEENKDIPIIFLSARGEEADKVLGLELGADDYVTKPFSPRELLVRVKTVLRRTGSTDKSENEYLFDDIKVDFKRFQVLRKDKEIKLTAAEFKILKLMIVNLGEPVSRHSILSEIWSSEVTTRTVDTHIWNLREKLEKDPKNPKHIVTVHRIGYKFV